MYVTGCPRDWLKIGSSCLRLYTALLNGNSSDSSLVGMVNVAFASYPAAQAQCRRLGGNVAAVTSVLLGLLQKYLVLWNHVDDGDIWIGSANGVDAGPCNVIRVSLC